MQCCLSEGMIHYVLWTHSPSLIILGDSLARECASEVSHLLNNDFEVLGFVNPGAGMKYIKDKSRVKVQQ